ncbi:MAG TPA: amino acid ABC transporter permease [Firmicutes bacterium]|nr:amino acid ABC transporter permease [Bacillota bacterium]
MHWGTVMRFSKFLLSGAFPEGPLGGLLLTLELSLVAGVGSFAVGLVFGLCRVSRFKLIRIIATIYVEVVRGIPFIMALFWFYFLFPRLVGLQMTEVQSALIALTFFFGAYATEIVRAGILSVPRGQTEAALATGLNSLQLMIYIVLPQAFRNMIPSFVNLYVSLIKDTSLAYFIGVVELTGAATQVMRRESAATFEIFVFILVIYLLLCSALNALSDKLEHRFAIAVKH